MTGRTDERSRYGRGRALAAGVVGVVLALPLAACSEDTPEPEPTGTTGTPTEGSPTPDPTPTDGTTAPGEDGTTADATDGPSPTDDDTTDDAPDDDGTTDTADDGPTTDGEEWTTTTSESPGFPSAGGDLLPVAVRTGEHEDYDRVVIDFEGTGTPDWRVSPVDVAVEDPRGTERELAGSAILEAIVSGVRIPEPEEYDDVLGSGTVDIGDLDEVEEVYVTGLFEGQMQLFLGLDEEQPFRVFTLDDPVRLVIDVSTED